MFERIPPNEAKFLYLILFIKRIKYKINTNIIITNLYIITISLHKFPKLLDSNQSISRINA